MAMIKLTHFLWLFIPFSGFAQLPQTPFAPKHYVCYRTPVPLQIDGLLSETAWQHAAWTDTFVDIEGDVKPLPRHNTRVKMLWDDQYLYVGAVLEEPHVWATLTEHESVIFRDNDFEIFIDPDGDTHLYYEFEINAFATTWDLLLPKPYRDGGPSISGWDMDALQAAVSVQGSVNDPLSPDTTWTVEIALPMQALAECASPKRPPFPGEQWRINFSRVQWQTEVVDGKYQKIINSETGKSYPEDNWVWSPQGVINMHYPEMWGFLQFSGNEVSQGGDSFVYQQKENIKWVLRQLYYRQRIYKQQHGHFAEHLNALEAETIEFKVQTYTPSLEVTSSLYEIYCTDPATSAIWHINQEGKVWQTNK